MIAEARFPCWTCTALDSHNACTLMSRNPARKCKQGAVSDSWHGIWPSGLGNWDGETGGGCRWLVLCLQSEAVNKMLFLAPLCTQGAYNKSCCRILGAS